MWRFSSRGNAYLRLAARSYSSSQSAPTIGIIGMGMVGSAMACNLLKAGHGVKYYYDTCPQQPSWGRDVITGQLQRLDSVKSVAQKSDVVITAVGRPHEVREVVLGEQGLFEGLSEGDLWIEHSTSSYKQTRELCGQAASRGVKAVECPVTGGLAGLRSGSMSCFVGGEEDAVAMAKPIVSASCTTMIHVGPVGTATITKVLSNMLCAVNFIGGYEAMMVAKKAGIDLEAFWRAMRVSSGASFAWETAMPFVMKRDYEKDFTIDLHCKDFQLGHDIAREYEVPMEMNFLAQQIFNRARAKFGKEAGCYISAKLMEDDLHADLEHSGFNDWEYDLEQIKGSLLVHHKNIRDADQ